MDRHSAGGVTRRSGSAYGGPRRVLYQESRTPYVLIWLMCLIYGVRWIVDPSYPRGVSTWLGWILLGLASYLWLWRSRRIGVSVSGKTVLHLDGLFSSKSILIEEMTEIRCPPRGPLIIVTKAGRETAVRVAPRWGPNRDRLFRDLQAQLLSQ